MSHEFDRPNCAAMKPKEHCPWVWNTVGFTALDSNQNGPVVTRDKAQCQNTSYSQLLSKMEERWWRLLSELWNFTLCSWPHHWDNLCHSGEQCKNWPSCQLLVVMSDMAEMSVVISFCAFWRGCNFCFTLWGLMFYLDLFLAAATIPISPGGLINLYLPNKCWT